MRSPTCVITRTASRARSARVSRDCEIAIVNKSNDRRGCDPRLAAAQAHRAYAPRAPTTSTSRRPSSAESPLRNIRGYCSTSRRAARVRTGSRAHAANRRLRRARASRRVAARARCLRCSTIRSASSRAGRSASSARARSARPSRGSARCFGMRVAFAARLGTPRERGTAGPRAFRRRARAGRRACRCTARSRHDEAHDRRAAIAAHEARRAADQYGARRAHRQRGARARAAQRRDRRRRDRRAGRPSRRPATIRCSRPTFRI